jgi:limonene-1,2-epoxide hydrolase
MEQAAADTPSVLLERSAERLRQVIINFNTMTVGEVKQSLIFTHRDIYETLMFYTNESRPHIPHY